MPIGVIAHRTITTIKPITPMVNDLSRNGRAGLVKILRPQTRGPAPLFRVPFSDRLSILHRPHIRIGDVAVSYGVYAASPPDSRPGRTKKAPGHASAFIWTAPVPSRRSLR